MNLNARLISTFEREIPIHVYKKEEKGMFGFGVVGPFLQDWSINNTAGTVVASSDRKQAITALNFMGFKDFTVFNHLIRNVYQVWDLNLDGNKFKIRIISCLNLIHRVPFVFDCHPFGTCTPGAIYLFNNSAATLAHELVHLLGYFVFGEATPENITRNLTPNLVFSPLGGGFWKFVTDVHKGYDSYVDLPDLKSLLRSREDHR